MYTKSTSVEKSQLKQLEFLPGHLLVQVFKHAPQLGRGLRQTPNTLKGLHNVSHLA